MQQVAAGILAVDFGLPKLVVSCSSGTPQLSSSVSEGSTCTNSTLSDGLASIESVPSPRRVKFGDVEEIAVPVDNTETPLSSAFPGKDDQGTAHNEEKDRIDPDIKLLVAKVLGVMLKGVKRSSAVEPSVIDTLPSGGGSFDGVNIPQSSIGSYVFTEEIARTSHGIVRLADTGAGSIHCVKCFNKSQMDEHNVECLKLETELIFELGIHPNIGSAIEIFQDPSRYYLVQPYYRGGNLIGLKKRAECASVATENWWKRLFLQCLKGMAHMHSRDVMHCDIKEANIMLKDKDLGEPEAVIIDFGVAQRASNEREVIYGTPGYIPPEVWEGKTWYPKSDMFSFGVVVTQLLIGKVGIFTEDTRTYKDIKGATQVRRPPFELMLPEHPSLRWVAEKLLAKDQDDRLSANDLLEMPWKSKEDCNADAHSRVLQRCKSCPLSPLILARDSNRSDSQKPTIIPQRHGEHAFGNKHRSPTGSYNLVASRSAHNILHGDMKTAHSRLISHAIRPQQGNLSTPHLANSLVPRGVRTSKQTGHNPTSAEPSPVVCVAQGCNGGVKIAR
jgi:serine/threonine protein kinase